MSRRQREQDEGAVLPEVGTVVLPGSRLFSLGLDETSGLTCGPSVRIDRSGTNRDGNARASVLGTVAFPQDTVVDVSPLNPKKSAALALAPSAGSRVLFRVTKVTAIGVAGPIVAINNQWCLPTFRGLVRLDDIRSVTAKEIARGSVPTHAAESMRLGDLVAADVLSLTEARQFQLTTTPPHCGVVRVFSERKTDGKYRRVPGGRRDQIIVESDTGVARTVSRWVPVAE